MPMIATRGRKTIVSTIVASLFAGTMLVSGAHAQEGATCDLVPLELPLFGGTPVAEFATPGAMPSPMAVSLPQSQAEEVLQQYVACTNTGDPTLVWAMFSPRWFSQEFADSEEHYLPAFEQMLDREGEPTGVPLELVEIVEIETLEDSRVAVTATFRSGDQEWTDKLTLVAIDGQWLIDEVELIEPQS